MNDIIGAHVISSYQINARTELAVRYNDISPLENHHCAIAFEILEKVMYTICCLVYCKTQHTANFIVQ